MQRQPVTHQVRTAAFSPGCLIAVVGPGAESLEEGASSAAVQRSPGLVGQNDHGTVSYVLHCGHATAGFPAQPVQRTELDDVAHLLVGRDVL